jgi:hypothetical protein
MNTASMTTWQIASLPPRGGCLSGLLYRSLADRLNRLFALPLFECCDRAMSEQIADVPSREGLEIPQAWPSVSGEIEPGWFEVGVQVVNQGEC